MADPFDFSEQQDAQTGAGQPGILDRWGAALQQPSTRASLMQIGLQLMQPMGFGQSPMGHLAQAVGAGPAHDGRASLLDPSHVTACNSDMVLRWLGKIVRNVASRCRHCRICLWEDSNVGHSPEPEGVV